MAYARDFCWLREHIWNREVKQHGIEFLSSWPIYCVAYALRCPLKKLGLLKNIYFVCILKCLCALLLAHFKPLLLNEAESQSIRNVLRTDIWDPAIKKQAYVRVPFWKWLIIHFYFAAIYKESWSFVAVTAKWECLIWNILNHLKCFVLAGLLVTLQLACEQFPIRNQDNWKRRIKQDLKHKTMYISLWKTWTVKCKEKAYCNFNFQSTAFLN